MKTISAQVQQLTSQFYEWEMLGRGWLRADMPVDLEPPFTPFFGHFLRQRVIEDDGVRHTLLSGVASVFKKKTQHQLYEPIPEVSYELFPFEDFSPLITLQLIFPNHFKGAAGQQEQLLTMLSYCSRPISFEIIGSKKQITIQFVCREADSPYIKSQLATYFKGVSILELETDFEALLIKESSVAVVDFGLEQEFMRPIGNLKNSIDPHTGIFSILEHLQEDEQIVFQVLFNGVLNHWQSSIIRSVSNAKGEPFFEDAPEMLPLAKEKVANTILTATIRILAQAPTLDESFSLLQKTAFAIITNTRSSHNALIPLSDTEYSFEKRFDDIIFRQSHRIGMILNTKELSLFIHLPEPSLISKKILGDAKKTKTTPSITEGHPFVLGKNIHNGIEKEVSISNEQRLKHTHIIGATGTGKSTLLQNMICQDIQNEEGIAVLDPHGDLIDALLNTIPQSRMMDVIIIDPADSEFPISFNILKAHSDIEKEVLSSDLVAAFRKLSTSWGDQMNSVFANAILAFLESNKGGTLIDLRRFLIEKPFREDFLKSIPDPSIKYYWQKEYPLLKTNSVGPILTRLDAFLRPRLIRNMVAQQNGIDFDQILNQKKILLVKLSQGLIGAENSYLLGAFVVSKIHQAALARQSKQERNNFFFYIDEFQHFITPSMSHILSGARKYHLGLILAHQDLQQLQKTDGDLLNTLISNAGTRICFRLGDGDAKKLSDGFSFFDAPDLQNLSTGEAIVRIDRPEWDFSLSTTAFKTSEEKYSLKQDIINYSRDLYSTPRQKVEELIKESMGEGEVLEEKERYKPQVPKKEVQPIPEPKILTLNKEKAEATRPISEKDISGIVKRKEETQHRYLQTLIKKVAESKEYKATIEMPTPNGKGSIDVLIEGNKLNIACEVSVTTDSNWEIHNIEKCLSAGYDYIFVCCVDKKANEELNRKVQEKFDSEIQQKIFVTAPEGLFDFLDKKSQMPLESQTTLKGYRVKVGYDILSQEEQKRKRDSVAKIVLESIRKMKK